MLCVFESFTFGGQWWCSVWSWVRIFDVWVNGRGFESCGKELRKTVF
jgi:hypothetical protein